MKTHIKDFVVVEKHDNGDVHVSYDVECRTNIYKYLHGLGFCQTKLNDKRVFYRRTPDGIFPVDFNDIEDVFFEKLKEIDCKAVLGVAYADVFDMFLIENPIKQYRGIYNELKDDMTPKEAHDYLMKADPVYRVKTNLKLILQMLHKYQFTRTVDTANVFSKMAPLYYKRVGENQYLLFHHFNFKERPFFQGFDCWLVQYGDGSIEDINEKKMVGKYLVKANFKDTVDFGLISQYLEN